ncbi:ADP-ribosylglycohydrolase family protein [Thermodesulfatator autotrophicus]|uniref:ADP-ribosylglycohydrolase n=1 Tax=Thermodesulfatator autotrophicus TaxID=1795632 RepID=A0A177E475_9BACT|nr:ADP-ribosylglycohydrolase family protein [Thermodesulfatator autotrophicus]OAG26725.1 ADP-ribosylglycohydrolase [Thermodesulfatator autotrophicus]
MTLRERYTGCLLGLAVGDALGTPLEFQDRNSFEPVTDMIGGGPHSLEPGQWTDDTSMALCLAESLLEKGGFDPYDQMKRYLRWYQKGYLSSTGKCFDIGNTIRAALERFRQTGNPFAGSRDPWSAGNGCIMRLAPVPMFFFPDIEKAEWYARESARTTHGAKECLDASRLFARMLIRALAGKTKEEILLADSTNFKASPKILDIARGSYFEKEEYEIKGSGYVVESLEAALWCFWHSDSFEEAVLKAVNLGDDADTTGAVCGQIAGSFYGEKYIPQRWLKKLTMYEEIRNTALKLLKTSQRLQNSS